MFNTQRRRIWTLLLSIAMNVEEITSSSAKPQHRVERHTSFVIPFNENNCFLPPEYALDINESCNYVRNTSDCSDVVRLFDYLDFLVCYLNCDTSIRGIIILMSLAVLLLILYMETLYIIANYFLVPNFVTLASHINVLGFDFGFTIIALLLSLPVFLSHIFVCPISLYENPALLLIASLGEVMACFAFGLAVVSFKRVFRFKSMHLTRNILFLMLGNIYLVEMFRLIMNSPKKSYSPHLHAANFVLIYASYWLYIVFSAKITLWYSEKADVDDSTPQHEEDEETPQRSLASDEYSDHDNSIHDELEPWALFLRAINPSENMKDLPYWYFLLASPIFVVSALLIPVINEERPLHGWCKLIICLSFLTYPFHFKLVGVPVEVFYSILFIGIMVATLVLTITHAQRVPQHHVMFSLLGIVISLTIFYVINSELDTLLWQLLNYLFDWRNGGVAMLAYPWGQRFVVCILAWTLMKSGYIDMALGMVIGINIFTTYMTMPTIMFSFCGNESQEITVTAEAETGYIFMQIMLVTTWLGISITNFEFRMSHGIYVLCIYLIFAMFINLTNSWTVHPYGTYHYWNIFKEVADWA